MGLQQWTRRRDCEREFIVQDSHPAHTPHPKSRLHASLPTYFVHSKLSRPGATGEFCVWGCFVLINKLPTLQLLDQTLACSWGSTPQTQRSMLSCTSSGPQNDNKVMRFPQVSSSCYSVLVRKLKPGLLKVQGNQS